VLTLELDTDVEEGKPGGSGMPACFGLWAGGFLSSSAHGGSAIDVVSEDIV
jgi:hypothetical protein